MPCLGPENNCFGINYDKVNGRVALNIIERSIINRKMTTLRVYDKKVIECIS